MRGWRGAWVLLLLLAGCHGLAAPRTLEIEPPPNTAPSPELPPINPMAPLLDAHNLPSLPPRRIALPDGITFRQLREIDCQSLAATNTSTANLLEQENQVPAQSRRCQSDKADLLKSLREHTALELRNRSAADALERFFQLTELEARTDLLRRSFHVIDELIEKAQQAKVANVRFPFELADLTRQRSQMETQLEQSELGSRLLNLDLQRRLGLPYVPGDRLWPVGNFTIDPTTFDPEAAVAEAMASRPELRGLRAFYSELTVDTLPDARDLLRIGSPLLGSSQQEPRLPWLLQLCLQGKARSDEAKQAELEVRKRQLRDYIAERERAVADETRAAVFAANSQLVRARLAQDRLAGWEEKLAEAEKKRAASQPGAEFLVPQVQLELLKARSELAAEVAAWHQARIRIKAAQGWLVWEVVNGGRR